MDDANDEEQIRNRIERDFFWIFLGKNVKNLSWKGKLDENRLTNFFFSDWRPMDGNCVRKFVRIGR